MGEGGAVGYRNLRQGWTVRVTLDVAFMSSRTAWILNGLERLPGSHGPRYHFIQVYVHEGFCIMSAGQRRLDWDFCQSIDRRILRGATKLAPLGYALIFDSSPTTCTTGILWGGIRVQATRWKRGNAVDLRAEGLQFFVFHDLPRSKLQHSD